MARRFARIMVGSLVAAVFWNAANVCAAAPDPEAAEVLHEGAAVLQTTAVGVWLITNPDNPRESIARKLDLGSLVLAAKAELGVRWLRVTVLDSLGGVGWVSARLLEPAPPGLARMWLAVPLPSVWAPTGSAPPYDMGESDHNPLVTASVVDPMWIPSTPNSETLSSADASVFAQAAHSGSRHTAAVSPDAHWPNGTQILWVSVLLCLCAAAFLALFFRWRRRGQHLAPIDIGNSNSLTRVWLGRREIILSFGSAAQPPSLLRATPRQSAHLPRVKVVATLPRRASDSQITAPNRLAPRASNSPAL